MVYVVLVRKHTLRITAFQRFLVFNTLLRNNRSPAQAMSSTITSVEITRRADAYSPQAFKVAHLAAGGKIKLN